MALISGTKLGPYEIQSPLGAGGMGEVYRARDTRLGRDVAIKILPAHLSADKDTRQRFEREARTVSALNHPNICTLYDIGHQDGTDFIVMEYVEGETLEQRLTRGPLPLAQMLKHAAQIADALDKAHRSGVIHRDLKPGNIMLTKSGAKLLDFGLAKPAAFATGATMSSVSPSPAVTQEGTIVGTFQYMSPEQLEGRDLDARTDIFSLGAVLYEMVTGKKAFAGKSQISVASAIIEKDPEPITHVAPLTPPNLDHVIARCLAKERDERWQTASDVATELKWIALSGRTSATAMAEDQTKGKQPLVWAPWVICAVLVVAWLLTFSIHREPGATQAASVFLADLPFPARSMAFAPNGHTIAIAGPQESAQATVLWLYEIGGTEAKMLPQTERATFPFWSPDGKSLAFFADGKLKRLDIAGGPVQVICDAPSGRGGTWSKDGVIVFTPSGQLNDGLYRVSAAGGTSIRITTPDASRGENTHRWPMFLPDQKHFLYLAANVSAETEPDAIFVGALDSNQKTFLTKATANAEYVAPGYLLFYRERTLFAQAFDASTLALSGRPVALLNDLVYLPLIKHAAFSGSGLGTLTAQRGSGISLSRLEWYDRQGRQTGIVADEGVYANVSLTRSGEALAADRTDVGNQNNDVWTYDLRRSSTKRLTFDPAIDTSPVWSPDGTQIVFASSRTHLFEIYLKNANGTEDEKLLPIATSDRTDKFPSDWSRDGKHILYGRGSELWVADYPGLQARPFLRGPAIRNGQFSPDVRWVAYASNENGRWEIYVTSFPDARGKWQISNSGGTQPRWRADGKELFYLASEGQLMAVPIAPGTNFDPGAPIPLFRPNSRELVATSEQWTYDVTKDGQHFLIDTRAKNAEVQPMTTILNWPSELKEP